MFVFHRSFTKIHQVAINWNCTFIHHSTFFFLVPFFFEGQPWQSLKKLTNGVPVKPHSVKWPWMLDARS